MLVLVLNAGSSSLKCSVFDTASDQQLFKTAFERLENIEGALQQIVEMLQKEGVQNFEAVAHRVVHGGSRFRDACLITDDVIESIAEYSNLAPLHNPSALACIKAASRLWPELPQVAAFDTAFHQTIPERAFVYAVPKPWRDTGLRRYGFHGTSHKYVMQHVAASLQATPQDLRLISCHLGNGASVCAIDRGVSVDTSMGMTPLEGLVMGTRSGDIDPGLFAHLHRTLGLTIEEIEDGLYHRSGLAALSGVGNDMRDIEQRAAAGDRNAQLAIQVYTYRVHKYIGAYAAVMGGVDVIAFTGGIGENSASMRKRICERFDFIGLAFDDDANTSIQLKGYEVVSMHQPHSRVKVVVTATREQWMIAREAARILNNAEPLTVEQRTIPIAVSARHVHLTEETCRTLFGDKHVLQMHKQLSQPGQWAAEECIDIIGPRGELKDVRILGPYRDKNQIEISETDAFVLGIDVPLRLSGQVKNTPIVALRGPAGSVRSTGAIVAQRHLHAHTDTAKLLGLSDGQFVDVEVDSAGRSLVFKDVAVRVSDRFLTEMHIDTDEANAAHLEHGGVGVLKL